MSAQALYRRFFLFVCTCVCAAEYSGKQAAVMHELLRDGVLSAAVHTNAILLGRCARFDLLAVCHSKAVAHSRLAGSKVQSGRTPRSARRQEKSRASLAQRVHSIGLMPHDVDATGAPVSAKVGSGIVV